SQRLALAQVARHLGAAEIFRVVDLYARAGRSKTGEQSRHAGFVLRASFTFRLVIQAHDTHRPVSVSDTTVPVPQTFKQFKRLKIAIGYRRLDSRVLPAPRTN